MNITQESTGNLTANINIHLAPEDYKDAVNIELKRYAKQANMPGFRAGKVPIGMVKKMVGRAIVVEEVNKVVSKELTSYLTESKLDILGHPMPKHDLTEEDFDPDCKTDMNFVFEVGLAPDFEVNYDFKETPTQYEIEIDDAFFEEELKNYQDRFGEVQTPEEVGEGDIIYGSAYEVDPNGEQVEEGFQRMIALNPIRVENPAFFEPYLGMKLEEVADLDLFKMKEDVAEIGKLIFMEEEELEEMRDKTLKFEVKRINRITLAELNPEFFTKVAQNLQWEETEFADLEAFSVKMKEQMQKELSESAKWHFRNQVQKQLMEINLLTLPDEFLKDWLLENEERYETMQDVEDNYADFTTSVSWSLIVEKIQQGEGFERIEREDIEESIKNAITGSFASREEELTDEMMQQYIDYSMGNQEMLDMHHRQLTNERLYDYLDNKVTKQSDNITATDFVELQQKEQEAA
ncbi:MAG: trigger factor [Bacteroidota bacterium]